MIPHAMSSVSFLAVPFLLAALTVSGGAQETLWIDADSDLGDLELHHGFIHGRDEQSPAPDFALVNALKPEEWKLYKSKSYELAVAHRTKITYGLSNHYAWYKGGFPNATPWTNWNDYESYILYNMQSYDAAFPDDPVEFYDIWNEPDHSYFWTGSYSQLLELFSRAVSVIKSYNPDAKVVGPSISWYRPGHAGISGLFDFIVDLDTLYGVRLDAISWHENGGVWADTRPEDIPYRADYLRSQIRSHFSGTYKPELHVNEFMGGQVHLSPGWNAAYLHYLIQSGVEKATRAGWWVYSINPSDYWCDCWYGLNGMFMKDGQTPQPAYWVWRAFAGMKGSARLHSVGSDRNVIALAARDRSSNIITLLTGRYLKSTPAGVTVTLADYHLTNGLVLARTERIPNHPEFYDDPPQAISLPGGPILVDEVMLPVVNDSVKMTIGNYTDGDSYLITVTPPPTVPVLTGPPLGELNVSYDFRIMSSGPDQSGLRYFIDWGDGDASCSSWIGPYPQGQPVTVSHAWAEPGIYTVRCRARSVSMLESDWSPPRVMMICVASPLRR